MSDIWLISDTHFFHDNVLKFTDDNGNIVRGSRFGTMEEMNDCIVENWNRVVKDNDRVFHLGDVNFGSKEQFVPLWQRLRGRKSLILGNHDDAAFFLKHNLVETVQVFRMLSEFGVALTHVPVHPGCLFQFPNKDGTNGVTEPIPVLNAHGHLHHKPSPEGRYRSVCVEQIDYTPINIEELRIR